MLDTQDYFDSRWTVAEYGRAMAKNIPILRIGWPDVAASPRALNASPIDLTPQDVDAETGQLTDDVITRIGVRLELVRGQGHAVRSLNLFSKIEQAIAGIHGMVSGVGAHSAVYATLPNGVDIVAYPVVGVPTSVTLQDAVERAPVPSVAVVYDHVGLHSQWVSHLDWLGRHIRAARWVKASDVAWDFAGWSVQ